MDKTTIEIKEVPFADGMIVTVASAVAGFLASTAVRKGVLKILEVRRAAAAIAQ